MRLTKCLGWILIAGWMALVARHAVACCAVAHPGNPVVNADQTVILIWDPQTQTEHFIRKASFEAGGDDFGFIIPSPNRPELDESGNQAFGLLAKLTAPVVQSRSSGGIGCGCAVAEPMPTAAAVHVLEEKEVAGFDATVLQSDSAQALGDWLKDHDYACLPAVVQWAAPYVRDRWTFTALKLAKPKDDARDSRLNAAALRLTFKTTRPLFPYREPRYSDADKALVKKPRLLRIYFLAEQRYEGRFESGHAWTGNTVYSDDIDGQQIQPLADALKIPSLSTSAARRLTEIEDQWPYELAPGDVYFTPASDQATMHRPTLVAAGNSPPDATPYLLATMLMMVPLNQRFRKVWR